MSDRSDRSDRSDLAVVMFKSSAGGGVGDLHHDHHRRGDRRAGGVGGQARVRPLRGLQSAGVPPPPALTRVRPSLKRWRASRRRAGRRQAAEARLRVFTNWGRCKTAIFSYLGARTRIPLDAEKINPKKRLFYALLPQSSAKINFLNPPCKVKPDFAVSGVVLLN